MALIASLPMYDWPEVLSSTNAYWNAICESFYDHGIFESDTAPSLIRNSDPHGDWQRSNLLLSQTCGLPYVRGFSGKVMLLGSPVFDIDCQPGDYFSVIIAHKDNQNANPEKLGTARLAYNDLRSQSGYAAFMSHIVEAGEKRFAGELICSGSHRKSIQWVAEGKADFAAIDAVTYRLGERFEPTFKSVKVVAKTKATPGLPYITSNQFAEQKNSMNTALEAAIDGLAPAIRQDLFLKGYLARSKEDYQIIKDRWEVLKARGLVEA